MALWWLAAVQDIFVWANHTHTHTQQKLSQGLLTANMADVTNQEKPYVFSIKDIYASSDRKWKKKINSPQQQHKHKNIAEQCHHDQNKTQEGSKHVKEKLFKKLRLSTKQR